MNGNSDKYPNLAEAIISSQEEQKYLQDIAHKYVKTEHRNYLLARSIVMDVHAALEFYMDYDIAWLCSLGIGDLAFLTSKFSYSLPVSKKLVGKINKLDFFKKIEISNELKIFSKQTIKIFWKVNGLRVAFAHRYEKNAPEYIYCKKSIFEKRGIEKLIKDQRKVVREQIDFVDKVSNAGLKKLTGKPLNEWIKNT